MTARPKPPPLPLRRPRLASRAAGPSPIQSSEAHVPDPEVTIVVTDSVLPSAPVPAPAALPPPPRRREFPSTEARTGRSNQERRLYEMVVERVVPKFDPLTNAERTDLIEILSLYGDGTSDERRLLLDVARKIVRR